MALPAAPAAATAQVVEAVHQHHATLPRAQVANARTQGVRRLAGPRVTVDVRVAGVPVRHAAPSRHAEPSLGVRLTVGLDMACPMHAFCDSERSVKL